MGSSESNQQISQWFNKLFPENYTPTKNKIKRERIFLEIFFVGLCFARQPERKKFLSTHRGRG
jgi:hypothetical protein